MHFIYEEINIEYVFLKIVHYHKWRKSEGKSGSFFEDKEQIRYKVHIYSTSSQVNSPDINSLRRWCLEFTICYIRILSRSQPNRIYETVEKGKSGLMLLLSYKAIFHWSLKLYFKYLLLIQIYIYLEKYVQFRLFYLLCKLILGGDF